MPPFLAFGSLEADMRDPDGFSFAEPQADCERSYASFRRSREIPASLLDSIGGSAFASLLRSSFAMSVTTQGAVTPCFPQFPLIPS